MKFSIVATFVFVLFAGVSAVSAEEVVREHDGVALKKTGEVQSAGQSKQLKIEQSQHHDNIGWWSDRDAGWIGGIGGSAVGLMGALLGTLGALGKARRFVIATTFTMIGLGVLSLIVGLIALAIGQPYAVYYPLLLLGLINTVVYGGNLPGIRHRYEQIELRKMAVMDAR